MRNCIFCGSLANFYCLDCNAFSCFEDVNISRAAWKYPCQGRVEGHAFVPIIQVESSTPIMKAANPEMAVKEGRKFGVLLGKIFVKQLDLEFANVSALAQYIAIDVLGYRDAEVANAYTQGFISAIMETPTPDELSGQYATGAISLEDFQRLIQKALQAPKQD